MDDKKQNSAENLTLPDVFRSKIPACDQETTINTFRDDDYAVVYTCDNTMLTKLRRLQKSNPQAYQVVRVFKMGDEISGVEVKFPKKLLSFRTGGKLFFFGDEEGDEEEVDE